jgi:hypothetical protein
VKNNPEREGYSDKTAPQLGNEPSGIAAWLIRQAQQFEDQHAPQHLTIGLREAAGEIERLSDALALFACDCAVNERCAVPDNCRNFQARRMLEANND